MRLLNVVHTDEWAAVILYRGEKYAVAVELEYDPSGVPVRCVVDFKPAPHQELTPSKENRSSKYRLCSWEVKWGGWPQFLQAEIWPASDAGIPFDYLCTINTEWGDAGNVNVFILTAETAGGYVVLESYIEASCH